MKNTSPAETDEEIKRRKKALANRLRAKNVRLVLYFIFQHFGLPTGVKVAVKPPTVGLGWPAIIFAGLSGPMIGSARGIVTELLTLQSEEDGVLTPETISLFEEALKEIKDKSEIRYCGSSPAVVKSYLKRVLVKLQSNDGVRVAALCRADVVYYMGKALKNDRVSCFLAPELDKTTGETYVIDLLSGRKYKPSDLLLSLPE